MEVEKKKKIYPPLGSISLLKQGAGVGGWRGESGGALGAGGQGGVSRAVLAYKVQQL